MTDYIAESQPSIIEMNTKVFLRVVITGLVVGLATWLLTYLLERFILQAIFCGGSQVENCSNSVVYAGNIAAVITTIVGLTALVKLSVFRPLLIVLATMVSLWGMASWLSGTSLIEAVIFSALLYAACYAAYTWLARIRNAVVMIVVVVIVAVASRTIPMILL
jgi:hypothetical protein